MIGEHLGRYREHYPLLGCLREEKDQKDAHPPYMVAKRLFLKPRMSVMTVEAATAKKKERKKVWVDEESSPGLHSPWVPHSRGGNRTRLI